MSGGEKLKYDIAFSFSVKDEGTALALNDRLQQRFKTFIYTEHQKTLAGRNGEDAFSKVYGFEARLVVILYRSEWGNTPFTKIEQRAIRNRAFEKGYDFTFFIVTESGAKLPEWLERTRLYYGLERFGLDGAAGAIESKLMELGAEPQVEAVADRAARLERARQFNLAKKNYQESEQGVKDYRAAVESMVQQMMQEAGKIGGGSFRLSVAPKVDGHLTVIQGLGPFMTLDPRWRFRNSLDEAKLVVTIWDELPGEFDAQKLVAFEYGYELQPGGEPAFVDRSGMPHATKTLAQELLIKYMNESEKLNKAK